MVVGADAAGIADLCASAAVLRCGVAAPAVGLGRVRDTEAATLDAVGTGGLVRGGVVLRP